MFFVARPLLAKDSAISQPVTGKRQTTVVFVSQTVYPPFEFVDTGGEHTGMCIELIRWMSTELGFRTRFTDASFKDAQRAVLSGQAKVLTSFFYSEKRDRDFDFTQPVFQVPAYIFIAANRMDIRDLSGLNGKTVAMQAGDYAREFLESKDIPVRIMQTRNFAEATDLVIAGKADALIGDDPIVRFHLNANNLNNRLKRVGEPLFVGQSAMAVKEGDTVIVDMLNRGIARARKQGILERITRKWLGVSYASKTSFWDVYRLPLALTAAAIGVVLVLVWLWNIHLRKEVDRKTLALRQSEEMLRRAIEEWERTFDAVPDLIAILDRDYRVLKMNRAIAETFNISHLETTDLRCHEIIHGLTEPPAFCPHARLLEDGCEHTAEFHDDRRGKDYRVTVSPLVDGAGQLTGCVHVARDITERKGQERQIESLTTMREALLRSTRLADKMGIIIRCMHDLFETLSVRVWMIDTAGKCGTPPGRIDGQPAKRLTTIDGIALCLVGASPPPLPEAAVDRWNTYETGCLEQLLTGDASPVAFDEMPTAVGYRLLSAGGQPIGAALFSGQRSTTTANNHLLATIASAVTHVLRAELSADALRQSERRHRELFESLIDVYFRMDVDGTITMVSPSVEPLMGYVPEALIGRRAADFWAKPDLVDRFWDDLRDNDILHNREVLLRKNDGTLFWAACNSKVLRDADGEIIGVEVMARDVTEQKQVDELMRIQRDLSVSLIHASDLDEALAVCLDAALNVDGVSGGGIYLMDDTGGNLNLMAHRNLPPAFVAMVSHLDHTSPQIAMVSRGASIFQSYDAMMDAFNFSPAERQLHQGFGISAVGAIPMSHAGRVIGCLNVASTTRRGFSRIARSNLEVIAGQMAAALVKINIDQALKTSQRNLETLFANLDDFLFILDATGHICKTNPVVERRLGYTAGELKEMLVTDVHPPERRQEAADTVERMLAGELDICPIPLMTRDGRLIPVETKVTMGSWNGRPALFGISRDISLRLAAEEARRVSEARLLAAIDAIDEGFVIYDKDDRLVMCNSKYQEIYKDSAEFIRPGARFEDIIRDGAHQGQYADADENVDRWVDWRVERHRRCDRSLEQRLGDGRWLKIVERRMEDGSTVGFRVDITDMKRSEALLRKALQEKETLLREIHHRVKNNLAVVASMLNLQIKHNPNRIVQHCLQESRARVRSMALIHETLYQTDELSAIPIRDYVRKLMRDLLSVYDGANTKITIDDDLGELQLDLNQAVYCGLVINELVTNAMKYAFVGKAAGTIRISATRDARNEITLRVTDDGVGLPPAFQWQNSQTLGLRLISLMVEQLHGTLELETHNGLDVVIKWKSSLERKRNRIAS